MNGESYMKSRNRKLAAQSRHKRETLAVDGSLPAQIFLGCVFYCNGHVVPTPVELYELVVARGGQKRHYERSDVTHVLATTLNDKKKADYIKNGKKKVVLPSWVTDSITAGRKLSTLGYSLISPPDAANLISTFSKQPVQSIERESNGTADTARSTLQTPLSALRMDSTDERFLAHYMAHSRLHHMSAWKTNFQDELRNQLMESLEDNPLPRIDPSLPRVIAHVDMDCFFASVAAVEDPSLAGKPLVVCYNGYGEISAVSYAAKKRGVKREMGVRRAKEICPDLVTVDFQFDAYSRVSRQLFAVLGRYSRWLQVVSCDEAFVDLTGIGEDVVHLGEQIRAEIFQTTGCCASVGIASSMLLAKMVCTSVKPNGLGYLPAEDQNSFLNPLPVRKIHGVGRKHEKKLISMGVKTIAELVKIPLSRLKHEFGDSNGQNLWNYSRGICEKKVDPFQTPKQVGIDVNLGIRFKSFVQVMIFIEQMAEELAKRLKGRKGHRLVLKWMLKKEGWEEPTYKYLGHGRATRHSKSIKKATAFGKESEIARIAKALYRAQTIQDVTKLVGIGITIDKLKKGNRDKSFLKSHSVSLGAEKWTSSQGTMSQHVVKKQRLSAVPYKILNRNEISQEVWDSLPTDVQRQLDAELKHQEHEKPSKRRKGAEESRVENQRKRSGPYHSLKEEDIDENVLDELPPDIRRQIMRDVKRQGGKKPAEKIPVLHGDLPRPAVVPETITQYAKAANRTLVTPTTIDLQGTLKCRPRSDAPQSGLIFGAKQTKVPLDCYLTSIEPHFGVHSELFYQYCLDLALSMNLAGASNFLRRLEKYSRQDERWVPIFNEVVSLFQSKVRILYGAELVFD